MCHHPWPKHFGCSDPCEIRPACTSLKGGGVGVRWERIRRSEDETRQKNWANLLFIKHLSLYNTHRIPCFLRHNTLKPGTQLLWHLQVNDNIRKIPSYSFPFLALLIVQWGKLHCQQAAKPYNLIYNNGIMTISELPLPAVSHSPAEGAVKPRVASTIICCLFWMCRRNGGGGGLHDGLRDCAVSNNAPGWQTPALTFSPVTPPLRRSL